MKNGHFKTVINSSCKLENVENGQFWINGKPIALLFGEKWSFWDPFSIEFKIGKCLNWTIFGEMASL